MLRRPVARRRHRLRRPVHVVAGCRPRAKRTDERRGDSCAIAELDGLQRVREEGRGEGIAGAERKGQKRPMSRPCPPEIGGNCTSIG